MKIYIQILLLGQCLEALQHSSNNNFFVELAQTAMNSSAFCVGRLLTVGGVTSTCFFGIPSSLETLRDATALKNFTNDLWEGMFFHFGSSPEPEPWTNQRRMTLNLLGVTNATQCVYFSNFGNHKHPLPSNSPVFTCEKVYNISYASTPLFLPKGFFLLCGHEAYTHVPAYSSGGPCAIGRLTSLYALPPMQVNPSTRLKRELSSDCESDVTLLSKTEVMALALSLVGVPALSKRTYMDLRKVACILAKSVNLTSSLIASLTEDIRAAVIQNRVAIDYLLLRAGQGCESFQGLCCFNLTNNENYIEAKLAKLKILASHISQDPEGWNWSWLTSWLPDFRSWGRKIVQILLFVLFAFILISLIFQCVKSVFQKCCISMSTGQQTYWQEYLKNLSCSEWVMSEPHFVASPV